ncbi:MAG TPA: hypothetical protein VEQ66_06330 [Propionibacteriaceae bacterium]|nr:hypothetical protein [Propionibacteriaceae bacterium]
MSGNALSDGPPRQPWGSREFDYGVGDDLRHAVRQVRLQIADEIRAAADRGRTPQAVQEAMERAARIAEQGRA